MRLVDNASRAWTWLSVQFMAAAIATQVAWESLPPEALAAIPEDWRSKITLALTVLALIGRVVKQESKQ
jgi:hypothetical protein